MGSARSDICRGLLRNCIDVAANRIAGDRERVNEMRSLGWFDPELGGHLVLDDIQKIIAFPAGSLILIPSATLTHRNLPVQDHEVRMSFTQFCSGGIFRCVDNGFRTQNQLKEQDPHAYQEIMEKKKSRWNLGLSLWSKLPD